MEHRDWKNSLQETAGRHASRRGAFSAGLTALAVAAVLVLVGGFSMRTALDEAGSHRELALEGAAAEQTSEGEPTGLELRLE